MKTNILIFILSFISIHSHCQLQNEESAAIDSIFMDWNKSNVPGCALGVMKNGELIYAKGYGLANLEYDIPNSASSVFRIGSTSKQFTAACIILLVEQGKLSLDKTLKEIFPEFPDYAKKITIQHLLNHTSGIRDYLQLSFLKGLGDDDYYKDLDVMSWLINQTDLNFDPGEEFLYSNSGYWLLGQIVHATSGMNMADFAEKEIFKPLQMGNTHFHNDHTQIVKNRASGYAPNGKDGFQISMTTLDMIGDGGIFTTINDIKKWDDAFYDSKVLSQNFWKMMTKHGVLNSGEVLNYASGLDISEYRGLKTIRHGGAFVGFRAELLRFPNQKLSIAIFANRSDANPSARANKVADIILNGNFVDSPTINNRTIDAEKPKVVFSFEQIIGSYEIQPGLILDLTIKNDSLNVSQTWNKSTYIIIRTSGNSYQIQGDGGISFTFSNLNEGLTQTMTIFQRGSETIAPRIKKFVPSENNLVDYIGSFYSKELDAIYYFELENGILKASIEAKETMNCTIVNKDQFSLDIGLVRFKRKDGIVSGFELDSGRVKNLKFEKQL